MRTSGAILLLLFFLATIASAQENSKFGVGVSLNPTSLIAADEGTQLFLPVGITNIRLAYTPSPTFRLEPELGYYSTKSELSGSGSDGRSSTFSSTRVGVSLYYRVPIEETFAVLIGPRTGVLWISEESDRSGTPAYTMTTSETDFYAGLALGGEYMLSNHFGIGAEAQLNYVSLGEPETEVSQPDPDPNPSPSPSPSLSRSMVSSNALVFVHFYF